MLTMDFYFEIQIQRPMELNLLFLVTNGFTD